MRNFFLALAILFTIAITFGSLIRIHDSALPQFDFSDKMVHVGAYGLLCMSWLLARLPFKGKPIHPRLMALFVFIYGIIIEVIQSIGTSHRQADWYDLLANLVGVLLALMVFNLIFRTKNVN